MDRRRTRSKRKRNRSRGISQSDRKSNRKITRKKSSRRKSKRKVKNISSARMSPSSLFKNDLFGAKQAKERKEISQFDNSPDY